MLYRILLFCFLPFFVQAQIDTEPDNNTFDGADPLALNGTVNSATMDQIGDKDFFKFQTTKRGFVTVVIPQVPSNMKCILQLYNEAGDIFKSKTGVTGIGFTYTFFLCNPQTIRLRVTDFWQNTSTDTYRIKVKFNGRDKHECNNEYDDATRIPLDTNFCATMNPSFDADYYKYTVPEAGVATISVTDVPSNIEMQIVLHGAGGADFAAGQDFSVKYMVCGGTNVFNLEDNVNSSNDEYKVKVEFNASDKNECNNTLADATPIECYTSIYGAINPRYDKDFYKFTVPISETVRVKVNSIPENINIYAFILDKDGNMIPGVGELGNKANPITITKDLAAGDYFIYLRGDSNFESPDTYRIRVLCSSSVNVNTPDNDGEVVVSPNPTSGIASLSKQFKIATIYKASGEKVETVFNVSTLNLENLDNGLYFLHLVDENDRFVFEKIVVSK